MRSQSISFPPDIFKKMKDEYESIQGELRVKGIYTFSALIVSRFFGNQLDTSDEFILKKRNIKELSHLCFRGSHEGNNAKITCKGKFCLCPCHKKGKKS